ncbi:hypothetical protein [Burkholderia sp. Nafp2/4-1b]|uniref:hypothetical protein n=1 Tax=Burkholderia sp. Nafp2/4-1b TaxID=2116686 RepID=UPI0013CF13AF|nr:hypothetical protein [Burkholderia sp. Nafp2/4-1b]
MNLEKISLRRMLTSRLAQVSLSTFAVLTASATFSPISVMAQVSTTQQSTTNLTNNLTFTMDNSLHQFFTQTITMPSGCPCYVDVSGQLLNRGLGLDFGTSGPIATFTVTDGKGNAFASEEHAVGTQYSSSSSANNTGAFGAIPLSFKAESSVSYNSGDVVTLNISYSVNPNGLAVPNSFVIEPDDFVGLSAAGRHFQSFITVTAGTRLPPPPTTPSFGTGTYSGS